MELVQDLPLEMQQITFDAILTANSEFKEQQRIIAILEALAEGYDPPEMKPPAIAYQGIESSGRFGFYFDAEVTGL